MSNQESAIKRTAFIHATAEVSPKSTIGEGTKIWHQAQVREGARIGRNCVISKGVYIDVDVTVGDNVKIQNGCFVYRGVSIEDGVFLGPGVILSNDNLPRAININGTLKNRTDWMVGKSLIKCGGSLGAGAIVLPDVVVGVFAMVGSGAVVTKDVPDYGLVLGNPARLVGFVCPCGVQLLGSEPQDEGEDIKIHCKQCGTVTGVPVTLWGQVGPVVKPLY